MLYRVEMTVNGQRRTGEVEARTLLVHFIREQLNLTGVHIGCDTTSCGACTILVDGLPVKSCTMFAIQADGCQIETVEGLADGEKFHPLQQAFWDNHGLQCGYCTPAMLMVAKAFLRENPDPTEEQIRQAISGNLCRCTGYQNIVKAIRQAAQVMNPATRVAAGKEGA